MRIRIAVAVVAVAATLIAAGVIGGTAMASPPTQQTPGVIISDVTIAVPGQPPVPAYVVRPQNANRPHSLAGVLNLHWFEPGAPNQDRTEFLAEAVALAARGTVSVLPQLRFPWQGDPIGDSHDRTAVTDQFDAVRRAYQYLLAQPGVDAARIAVVGHDYGAMYGAMLAQREVRVQTLVFMAGDATWANWFDTYWLDLPEDQKAAYRAVFHGLDPVDNVSRLGARVFFQWGDRDGFITPDVRAAFASANPAAKATLYTRADHVLTQQAKDDRIAWLVAQLHL